MHVRTVSDAMYTAIAWLPLLALAAGIVWVLAAGMVQLEMISFGTEFFVGNDETSNRPVPIGGPSDEDLLMAALESGDLTQMSAAVDLVESRNAAAPATAAAAAG